MLLSPNKKKIASLIVGSMKKPKGDFVQAMGEEPMGGYKAEGPEEEKDDASAALEDAMGDFLKAVEGKDAAAMASALQTAVYLCKEKDSEPEE